MENNTNIDPYKKAELILKSLQEELNPEETVELKNWLTQDEQNRTLYDALHQEEVINDELNFFDSVDIEEGWQAVASKTTATRTSITPWWQSRETLKYAAVFLVMLLSVALINNITQKHSTGFVSATKAKLPAELDIVPGGDKAVLTLADGTEIMLENAGNGTLKEVNGLKVIKEGGRIIFQFSDKAASNGKLAYNTISTPWGGQYQLVLPDGTRVWLNAATSLRFPTAFSATDRTVELTGEGYFEVEKDKKRPFKVKTASSSVEVLGTHFNLMAYPGDASSKTTLLEGLVKVDNGSMHTILTPGKQAIVAPATPIKTIEADLEQVIAWKEGYFLFNDEDFAFIATQLERWYNIDFIYPPEIAEQRFGVAISRNNNLSQVLEILELSGSVKFKIEERRIMVTAK